MNKDKLSQLIDLAVSILAPIVWLMTVFQTNEAGTLEAVGLRGLRFFTVQSNLLAGLAAQIYLLRSKLGKGQPEKEQPDKGLKSALVFKFVAAVAVSITFFTVILFLGPLYGYAVMYIGTNLFFHLIIPFLAMISICISNLDIKLGAKEIPYTALPVLIYGIFYLGNILINGIGEWPKSNDWYGFLIWGFPVGIFIFAVLIAMSLLIGFVFVKIRKKLSGQ